MVFVSDSKDTGALACGSDGILTLHIQQKVGSELQMQFDDLTFLQISGLVLLANL